MSDFCVTRALIVHLDKVKAGEDHVNIPDPHVVLNPSYPHDADSLVLIRTQPFDRIQRSHRCASFRPWSTCRTSSSSGSTPSTTSPHRTSSRRVRLDGLVLLDGGFDVVLRL